MREGLFDVNILAGSNGGHEHGVMKMFGGRDKDDVNRLVSKQFLIVGVSLRGVAAEGEDAILGARQVPRVGVAHRNDLRDVFVGAIISSVHALHQVIATAAGADPADGDLIIRALGVQDSRRGGEGGGGLHEVATGEIGGHGGLLQRG